MTVTSYVADSHKSGIDLTGQESEDGCFPECQTVPKTRLTQTIKKIIFPPHLIQLQWEQFYLWHFNVKATSLSRDGTASGFHGSLSPIERFRNVESEVCELVILLQHCLWKKYQNV